MGTYWGNDANNTFTGDSGVDYMYGNGGDDTLNGNAGDDKLYGGGGIDNLNGGLGLDTLYGGADNDFYNLIYDFDNVIEKPGEGIDKVNAWFDYQLPDNVENLGLQGNAVFGFGNGLDNTLYGNAQNNILYGFVGDDWLHGGDGADTLLGGQDDDHLDGQAGADTMEGNTGDDFYYVDNPGDVVKEKVGEGIDAVLAHTTYALADNVEYLFLIEGDGAINGYGNGLDNWINGNSSDNVIGGGDGHDVIHGNGGNDKLYGGIGDDLLVGGSGADTLNGGADNDTLRGWGNVDVLIGGDGDDHLEGGADNDNLDGGGDGDTLTGGTGEDTLTGGAGNDVFVFTSIDDSTVAAPDDIIDFAQGTALAGDRIDLSEIDANTGAAGDQAFMWIGNNNPFVPAWGAGQLTLNGHYIEGDTDGDMIADFRIDINVTQLNDFAFIP
jgi:Ca2+-binding RTX toxin-like protein